MRRREGSFGAIAVALAVAVVLIAAGGVLAALPALLAFGLLFAGRYPGAARLDRLILRAAHRPAMRAPVRALRPPTVSLSWRGGELIARSLAKRPPPVLPSSG